MAMRENQYTPGPWREFAPEVDGEVLRDYRTIQAGNGFASRWNGNGFSLTGYIDEPNAKLIATAPTLLKELKVLLEAAEQQWTPDVYCLERIRDLIAKVES